MQRILLGFLLAALIVVGPRLGWAEGALSCDLPPELIVPTEPFVAITAQAR